jgi:hypothetical protein
MQNLNKKPPQTLNLKGGGLYTLITHIILICDGMDSLFAKREWLLFCNWLSQSQYYGLFKLYPMAWLASFGSVPKLSILFKYIPISVKCQA